MTPSKQISTAERRTLAGIYNYVLRCSEAKNAGKEKDPERGESGRARIEAPMEGANERSIP